VFDGVEVRALCRPVKFTVCTGALSC
jgi:hypothetical protein